MMGIFGFFKQPDINTGVEEYNHTQGGVLLDVRTPEEYREGHVRGSINIPLQSIGQVSRKVPDTGTPLFVYCLSGARSRQAVSYLKSQGYEKARNIGGFAGYRGEAVTGA